MPNIKSQIKRAKQTEKRHLRNKAVKSAIKTHISEFNKVVEGKDKKKAEETLKVAVRALDKAVSKGAIHRNQAANKKSHLTKKLNTLK